MNTALRSVYQPVLKSYFSIRNSWPVWYGLLNRSARTKYAAHRPKLNPTQSNILEELERDGIAFTTLDALFPGQNMLEKLRKYAKAAERPKWEKAKKEFLVPYWDSKPVTNMDNPFLSFALSTEVLSIVNSYDKMWRRLNYYHLADTIPVGDKAPVQSQRWHRDPEEKRMVKAFIYLTDVDSEAGPFTYVRKSQFLSPTYGKLFPQELPLGVYPDADKVLKAILPEDIVEATGKAGSVLFCDTAGLHRGGHAKSKERTMFTSFYPSNWWSEGPRFTVNESTKSANLSPEARYALFLD